MSPMTATAAPPTGGGEADEISPREARKIIGERRVSLRTVQRWADDGTLPSRRMPHGLRARRIPRAAAEDMAAEFDRREHEADDDHA